MSELEKMNLGLLYDPNYDLELIQARNECKDLCHQFNLLKPSMRSDKAKLIQKIFNKVGSGVSVMAPFWCDYGFNIEVGDNFYANHNCVILDGAKVVFGDNVFIAPNCVFTTAGHPLNYQQRNQGLEYAYSIEVGDNVWFGAGVMVLPGVKIGNNVVIGAGSVVNKDIPDGVVAVGNPCKVLKKIDD